MCNNILIERLLNQKLTNRYGKLIRDKDEIIRRQIGRIQAQIKQISVFSTRSLEIDLLRMNQEAKFKIKKTVNANKKFHKEL